MKKDVKARDRRPLQPRRRFVACPPALVRPRALAPQQVIVSCGGRVLFAAMGRGGILTLKREGDGATPRARIRPVDSLGRARRPTAALPFRRIRASDGWCDDPASGRYNCLVKRPFPAGHEQLLRDDAIYDNIFVTNHNQKPRVRGAGSAIFIHVAQPGLSPTAGCLAFPAADWHHGMVPTGDYLIGVDPRRVSRR